MVEICSHHDTSDPGKLRSHFYAGLASIKPAAHAAASAPRSAVLGSLLGGHLLDDPLPAAAAGRVAVLEGSDGFRLHPAAAEASMHVCLAHPDATSRALRIVAKVEVAQAGEVAFSSSPAGPWAVGLPGNGGKLNSHWLLAAGADGSGSLSSSCPASALQGVETRRLVAQRPATQQPKTPRSPGAYTPRTPYTPFYLVGGAWGDATTPHDVGSNAAANELPAQQEGNFVDAETVRAVVTEAVHAIVGAAIGPDQPLMEAGIDSLGATELQQNLADALSLELPSTLVFDYPTVNAMTEFLAGKLSGGQVQAAASPLTERSAVTAGGAGGRGGIAIFGAAGQSTLLQEWRAGDASSRVPFSRWDVDSPLLVGGDGTVPVQFGVFMPDVDAFDAELFGVMRTEAVGMDPQQRLLLQVTHECSAAATGGSPGALVGHNIGTFVGIAATDYESLSHRCGVPISAFSFTAASPSVASGRISYVFGLRGPAVSVDTACSASLVAAHMACAAFREGPMEAAVAAGVLLCLVPESTLMLSRAQMLSAEGRSKTLDASADGYVRGEACRGIFLRQLAYATIELHPLGVLVGSAVNTNGRASSLTAPNGPAQQVLLREAMAAAGVRPADVAGLQMHSNGTALGDPIEVGAAAAVALVSFTHLHSEALVCGTLRVHVDSQSVFVLPAAAGGPAPRHVLLVCHSQGLHRPPGVCRWRCWLD